ncbi:MAG: hypothetical protein CM1200mP41_33710 [Gammaproteobacteria bacterium]|nr:MAG: hypothetical protein CM1200mP41_33710 [Gammaproteobacteria bacterium]
MVGGVGGMGVILQRWLTALVLGICLLSSVVFFNPLGFEVLVSVLAGAAYWEWLRMTLHRTSRVLCIGGGLYLVLLSYSASNSLSWASLSWEVRCSGGSVSSW